MLLPMVTDIICCWLRTALSLPSTARPPFNDSLPLPPHEASASEVQPHETSYLGRFSKPKRVLLPKGNQT